MATSSCVKRTVLIPRENATRFMGRVARRERRQGHVHSRTLRGRTYETTLLLFRHTAMTVSTRSFCMYRSVTQRG